MVQMTMQVPENLAPKLRRMDKWLPIVLELSLVGFKTPVTQTVAELIEFLAKGPTPKQVGGYKVSDRAQKRIQRLLALNESSLLSQDEQAELDESEKFNHLVTLLKARAHGQSAGKGK